MDAMTKKFLEDLCRILGHDLYPTMTNNPAKMVVEVTGYCYRCDASHRANIPYITLAYRGAGVTFERAKEIIIKGLEEGKIAREDL